MDFTTKLRCSRCGGDFPVDLSRMRLNLPNSCPMCGGKCEISSDRAISAHRLLERLELKNRTAAAAARKEAGRRRSQSSLPFGDPLQTDDPWPGSTRT